MYIYIYIYNTCIQYTLYIQCEGDLGSISESAPISYIGLFCADKPMHRYDIGSFCAGTPISISARFAPEIRFDIGSFCANTPIYGFAHTCLSRFIGLAARDAPI